MELRFFGGMSIEETAEILGVSPGTVMRDWTLAWLQREMTMKGAVKNQCVVGTVVTFPVAITKPLGMSNEERGGERSLQQSHDFCTAPGGVDAG